MAVELSMSRTTDGSGSGWERGSERERLSGR